MFSNFFFRKSCNLGDNVETYGKARPATDDNITWHMRFTCWINMTTGTHLRVRHPYCFSTATVVTPTRLSVSFILYVPCVVPFLLSMSIFLALLPLCFCLLYILFCLHNVSCVYTIMLPNSKQTLKHVWNIYLVIIFWQTFPFSRSTVVLHVLTCCLWWKKFEVCPLGTKKLFVTKVVWIPTVLRTCGRWFFFLQFV